MVKWFRSPYSKNGKCLRQTPPINLLRTTLFILVSALTLAPILKIIFIIASTGANNLSNDSLFFLPPIFDKIFQGTYDWKNFLRDTFLFGHLLALPTLIHLLSAYLTHWNVYAALYGGIFIVFLKLILLKDAFSYPVKYRQSWVLWPILSALLFSTSQISTFEFDFTTIQFGLTQFGFILGVWGLVRFPKAWIGISLMILGGLVASYSSGAGPLVWPSFLFGLIITHRRRWAHYLAWFVGAILSSAPYVYFMVLNPTKDPLRAQSQPFISFFQYAFIIKSIGFPFSQSFSLNQALIRGLVGLVLLLGGIYLVWSRRKEMNGWHYSPALMVLIYSFLNIYQISLFRFWLAPWYANPFMFFWIGLVGLAYMFWFSKNEKEKRSGYLRGLNIGKVWVACLGGVLVFFYLTSNLSYADKIFFLPSRSPWSAQCLRNYRTAPTYCVSSLFCWKLDEFDEEFPSLAHALERHGLSVFASHQKWSLQGDYVLGNVQVHEAPGIPGIFWSADLSSAGVPFFDYRHLNLFLHSTNSIEWTLTFPKNLKSAIFHSAVSISKSAPKETISDGVNFKVIARPEGGPSKVLFEENVDPDRREWAPFQFPLTEYAGQTVTITLISEPKGNVIHDWAMCRYPYIDINLVPNNSLNADPIKIRPYNTDLSGRMPTPTEGDFIFDVKNPTLWTVSSMGLVAEENNKNSSWLISFDDPMMVYKQPLNIPLKDYSYLYIRLKVPKGMKLGELEVFYKLNQQDGFVKENSMRIPLLFDGEIHEYTYDLRLIGGEAPYLTGIRLDPVDKGADSGETRIQLEDFRLIKKKTDYSFFKEDSAE